MTKDELTTLNCESYIRGMQHLSEAIQASIKVITEVAIENIQKDIQKIKDKSK